LLATRRRLGDTLEPLDLVLELVDVLEAAVDRGEAHVRNFVERPQLFHDQLANQPGRNFALTHGAEFVNEVPNGLLELVAGNRALLESTHHAVAQFVFIKRLAAAVVLDQPRHDEFSGLEGRETFIARQALPAPSDLPALARETRVYDLGFIVGAKRTVHSLKRSAVDRKSRAELEYLLTDTFDRLLVLKIVQYIRYPACDLSRFLNAKTTSRDCWRTESQAAGHEG